MQVGFEALDDSLAVSHLLPEQKRLGRGPLTDEIMNGAIYV